nr:transglutaminase-like domain-containing protein [Candidatus Njordarchaeum guaymaensis]
MQKISTSSAAMLLACLILLSNGAIIASLESAQAQGLIVVGLESETTDAKKNMGAIVFGGVEYKLPAYVRLELKDLNKWHSIVAKPPSGYVFVRWEHGGRVEEMRDLYSQSTEAYVEGIGQIKAWFKAQDADYRFEGDVLAFGYGDYTIKIRRVLNDPKKLFKAGDTVIIPVYRNGKVIGDVKVGSYVEVYGEYGYGVHQSYHYIKALDKLLVVDVWTDRGGQGRDVPDGTYQEGEQLTVYYSVSAPVIGSALYFEGPYKYDVVTGRLAQGTHSRTLILQSRDIGKWKLTFTAQMESLVPPLPEDSDTTWFTVTEKPPAKNVKYRGDVTQVSGGDYAVVVREILPGLSGPLKKNDRSWVSVSGQGQIIGDIKKDSYVEVYGALYSTTPGVNGYQINVHLSYHYIKINKPDVEILTVWLTRKQTEFETESSYTWVRVLNWGDTSTEATVLASPTTPDISIFPTFLKVRIDARDIVCLCFKLIFTRAIASASITFSIKDTDQKKTATMHIHDKGLKDTAISIYRLGLLFLLPTLNDLAQPTKDTTVSFAADLLRKQGLDSSSPDIEKAKVIYSYVTGPGKIDYKEGVVLPPSADEILAQILSKGSIEGDCKTYTVLFCGLARAVGLKVRPLAALFESSYYKEEGGLVIIAHAWPEVWLNDRWEFLDPTNGYFDEIPGQTIRDKPPVPANLNDIEFDAKKTYELLFDFGGPLVVESTEGFLKNIDLTTYYKLEQPAKSTTKSLAIMTKSPVRFAVYDSNGRLLAESRSYQICWPGMKPLGSVSALEQGEYAVLSALSGQLTIRITGTGVGGYGLYAASIGRDVSSARQVTGRVSSGDTVEYDLQLSPAGDVLAMARREPALPWLAIGIGASVIALIAFITFRKRGPRIKSVLESPRIKT